MESPRKKHLSSVPTILTPDSDTTTNPSPIGTDSGGRRTRKRTRDFMNRSEVKSSLVLPDLPPKIITEISQLDSTLNLGGSPLDPSKDVSDAVFVNILKQVTEFLANPIDKSMSARQIEFRHLIETERNYVAILINIVKNFKEACENEHQEGGRILDEADTKFIFKNILPIYSLHRKLLRDLVQLIPWSDNNLIGKVYCDHGETFVKAYKRFVNTFESAKEAIERCKKAYPRFKTFLENAQNRPDCGKQSLSDLMIRPIQRLPSTQLILERLLKHTTEPNPDAEWVPKALEVIVSVNKDINKGKQTMEEIVKNKRKIFDLHNEIDGCPDYLISAQRSFEFSIDVTTLSEIWGQKNDAVRLIVFNDAILAVRRRAPNKHLNSVASVVNLRSPSVSRKTIMPGQPIPSHHNSSKPYKYLELFYHTAVIRVLDITNVPYFGLVVRAPREYREFGFTLPEDPDWPKTKLINELAKLAAHSVDRLDYEIKLSSASLGSIDFYGSTTTALEKASRFANKTRHKVARALSMSKTPTSKLKRTVSQMTSPFFSSKSRQPDPDTISQSSVNMDCLPSNPTTPLRSNSSMLSLWGFGSRRGDGTPKSRRTLSDRETRSSALCSTFSSIQENQ